MIWDAIRRICPALAAVEGIALSGHRDGLTWGDVLVQVEPELRGLVGFSAANPRLRSTGIYLAVHRHLATCWSTGRSSRTEQEHASIGA